MSPFGATREFVQSLTSGPRITRGVHNLAHLVIRKKNEKGVLFRLDEQHFVQLYGPSIKHVNFHSHADFMLPHCLVSSKTYTKEEVTTPISIHKQHASTNLKHK